MTDTDVVSVPETTPVEAPKKRRVYKDGSPGYSRANAEPPITLTAIKRLMRSGSRREDFVSQGFLPSKVA